MGSKNPTPELIADLFDAATDDSAWAALAAKIAGLVGVEGGAVMLVQDGEIVDMSITANIHAVSGPYQSYYNKLDPWRVRAPLVPAGVVMLSSEIFPERELVKTEFYNDFARSFGMRRPLNA